MKKLTVLKWNPPLGGKGEKSFQPGAVLLGVLWAVSISIAVLVVLGLYIMISRYPVYHLSLVISLMTLLTVLLGGTVCGATANRFGLLHGILVGLIYSSIYLAFLCWWNISLLKLSLLLNILPLLLAGGIGGVIGVNLSAVKRRETLRMKH